MLLQAGFTRLRFFVGRGKNTTWVALSVTYVVDQPTERSIRITIGYAIPDNIQPHFNAEAAPLPTRPPGGRTLVTVSRKLTGGSQ